MCLYHIGRRLGWFFFTVFLVLLDEMRVYRHDLEASVFEPGSEAEPVVPVGSMPMKVSFSWCVSEIFIHCNSRLKPASSLEK